MEGWESKSWREEEERGKEAHTGGLESDIAIEQKETMGGA